MSYCLYFQAHVKKESVWIVTSILRSCEHLAFDRNIDLPKSIFEFYVPADSVADFISLMDYFAKKELVFNLQQLPNRLLIEDV